MRSLTTEQACAEINAEKAAADSEREARAKAAQDAHQAEEIRRQVFPLMSARQRAHFWERAFLVVLAHRYSHEDAKALADEALRIRDLAVSEIVTDQVKKS